MHTFFHVDLCWFCFTVFLTKWTVFVKIDNFLNLSVLNCLHFYIVCCFTFFSIPFSSVAQPWPTLCDPMNCSTPGPPCPSPTLELMMTQTHVHQVSDAIQPSHPLSSPSPPAPNPSQHQGLFQWVNSSHEVAKWYSKTLYQNFLEVYSLLFLSLLYC